MTISVVLLELFDYMRTHLTSVRVKNLILPEWTQPDDAYQQLVDKAQAAGVNVQKGRKGEANCSLEKLLFDSFHRIEGLQEQMRMKTVWSWN